jgi:hypothetical protein
MTVKADDLNTTRLKFIYLSDSSKNSTSMDQQTNRFQVMNLLTNTLTVIFFIVYSAGKRFEFNDSVFIVLGVLFGVNAIISVYLLFRYYRLKSTLPGKLVFWIVLRIVANVGLAILSCLYSQL